MILGFAATTAVGAANAEGNSAKGAEAYAAACARCHATPARIARGIRGTTIEERAMWLDAFLPRHHAADETLRAYIVAYLASR